MRPDPNLRRFSWIIFFSAFALRLLAAWITGCFHNFHQYEMSHIAFSLLRYHAYANPFLISTGPTAHETPIYPVFLYLIYLLFGVGPTAEVVKIVLSCLAVAVRCALIPRFCLAAGLSRTVAIAAGIISACYFSARHTELEGNWATPWQALALLFLIWMTLRIWKEQSCLTRTPWLYMISWGVAILLQPALIPVLTALLICGLIASSRSTRPRYLRLSVLTVLVVTAILTPWAVRNRMQLGKLIWTRSNFGLEFWLSNGPGRTFDAQTNLDYNVPHPDLNLREAQLVRSLGEVSYNQMKLAEAEAWVRGHPGEFTRMTGIRFLAWWFQPNRNPFKRVIAIGFSVAALAGFCLLFRIQRLTATLFGIVWLSFPPVYYVLQWISRYRYPMDWQLIVCVAVTVATVLQWLGIHGDREHGAT